LATRISIDHSSIQGQRLSLSLVQI
jgi:hypothetical protein